MLEKLNIDDLTTTKCNHIQEAVVKKKDTMTESMENTKKQSTHIFHFQNFVTEIFNFLEKLNIGDFTPKNAHTYRRLW